MEHQTAQQNAVAIAIIQTEVEHLKAAMADLKAATVAQSGDLKAIRQQLDEARGGWRTLVMLGGAAGALGSAIHWVISHVGG